MAINQYTFFIVPKNGYEENIIEFNSKSTRDLVEDNIFWENENVSCNLFDTLKYLLPNSKSWDNSLIIFGIEDSTCLKIFCNSSILSVSLRIDFTVNYNNVINEIIDFCIIKELLILDENLTPVNLNSVTICNIIQTSTQYKMYYSFLE